MHVIRTKWSSACMSKRRKCTSNVICCNGYYYWKIKSCISKRNLVINAKYSISIVDCSKLIIHIRLTPCTGIIWIKQGIKSKYVILYSTTWECQWSNIWDLSVVLLLKRHIGAFSSSRKYNRVEFLAFLGLFILFFGSFWHYR